MATLKDPHTIETAPPFSTMFPIDPAVLLRITSSMRRGGFASGKAVTVWRDAFGDPGRLVLTDGHTRLAAAIAAGIAAIPVNHQRYGDLGEAIAGTIGEQRDRRNLSTGQIAASIVIELDSGHSYPGQRNDLTGYSAAELAELAGCSKKTIDQLRAIIASGNEQLLADVRAGTLSVKAAYEKSRREVKDTAEREHTPAARPSHSEGDTMSEPTLIYGQSGAGPLSIAPHDEQPGWVHIGWGDGGMYLDGHQLRQLVRALTAAAAASTPYTDD
jgi:hypothetical protein